MKYLLILSCLFSVITGQAQLSTHDAKVITDFREDLEKDVRKDGLHGSISAAVIRKGQLVWAGAVGYKDKDANDAADSSNIYLLASITKTFTATLLMLLVEEGKVKLDDEVEKYVPEVRNIPGYPAHNKITLRELASHTSGLNREPGLPGASTGPLDQWENKVLACIPYSSFSSTPGTQFLYSNIGFALLGLALEKAAGVPYTQLVTQKIFEPLHMDNTFYKVPDDKKDHIAQGLDNRREGVINTELPRKQVEGMGYRVPNGGIWSTPSDLAKFINGLIHGALIRPESLRQMLTVPLGGKNYGLGIMFMHNRELEMIGHNGSDPGYRTLYAIEPHNGDAVIMLRNYDNGNTDMEAEARYILRRL